MNALKRISLLLIFAVALGFASHAQYASRKLSKKQEAYIDSLKNVEYNYVFPILGQEVYKRGFDIPYPAGAMVNYMWMKQGIVIENFQLGIQNDNLDVPLTPIDFIDFGTNTNTSYVVNFRPDLWVLPFLNVYGLFGYGSSTTEVNLVAPIKLQSIVAQSMSTKGFGVMSGFGLGPAWVAIDANWTWTKPELLEDAVLAKVMGVRLGKTFQFASQPERNVAFWLGGMRAQLGSNTEGNILLSDAIPQETWDRVDAIVADYDNWYTALPPAKQAVVDATPFPDFIERLGARDGNTMLSYKMDKRPEQEWNMLIGGQFQYNKRWMLRSEIGIVGDRKSFLASINYRFLL